MSGVKINFKNFIIFYGIYYSEHVLLLYWEINSCCLKNTDNFPPENMG